MLAESVDHGFERRRAITIARLLIWKEKRLKALGVELWRDAVVADRAMDFRKATSFDKWKLFILVGKVKH